MSADVGSRLRERLGAEVDAAKEQGATVQRIAASIGVDKSRIYDWISGRNEPTGADLAALADHLGCSMDWLWGRTADRRPVAELAELARGRSESASSPEEKAAAALDSTAARERALDDGMPHTVGRPAKGSS